MTSEVKRIVHTHITTDKLRVEYHPDEEQFVLIFFPDVLLADAQLLGELRIVLSTEDVRQLAAMLPPLPPEIVH
jgi:hypothetical protein